MDLLDIFNGFLRRFRDDLPVKTIFFTKRIKKRNMTAIRFGQNHRFLSKKLCFSQNFVKKKGQNKSGTFYESLIS